MNTTEPKTVLEQFTVVERAVNYGRVSGDDRGKDGRNLQGQLDMGREHCQQKGYRIIAELAEDDRGDSGADIDLPKLNQIREMARGGEFDVLIVRELDRLSRNLAKQLIVEEELKKCNVRIEYVLTDYDDTPEGQLQKHIKGAIAEYEREKIKERTVRGKRNKVKAGSVDVSGQPLFGYRQVDNGTIRALEIEPAEAKIVRYIFEQFLNGRTIAGIRDKLIEVGIPAPADLRKFNGVDKKSEYGKWNRSAIARILTNQTYAGHWHYGKQKTAKYRKENGKRGYKETTNPASTWIEVKVPDIIPQDVFDLVQEKLAENKLRRGSPGLGELLLRKRCTCGECGYKMASRTRNEKRPSYYTCIANSNKDLLKTCSQKVFRTDMVDAKVWEWIEKILTDPTRLEEEIANVESKQDKNGAMIKSQLEAAESKIAEFSQELNELIAVLKDLKKGGKAYAAVLADIDRVEDTINKLEAQRNKIKRQLNKVTLSPENKDRLKQFAAKVSTGIEKARQDFGLRKAIIDLLDVQVRLIREDGKAVAYITCILLDVELELSPTPKGGRQLLTASLSARLELD